jgi:hypothetical protein
MKPAIRVLPAVEVRTPADSGWKKVLDERKYIPFKNTKNQ